jgi:hypothetical protein
VTLVAVAAVTGLASTVVSGSIAIVGNVVYWLERQGHCGGSAPATAPAPARPSPVPAPSPASTAAATPPA